MGKGLGMIQKRIVLALGRLTSPKEDLERELLRYEEIREVVERTGQTAFMAWLFLNPAREQDKLLLERIDRECPTVHQRRWLKNQDLCIALGLNVKNGSHRAVVSRAISTPEKRGLVEKNSLTRKGWETYRRLEKQ